MTSVRGQDVPSIDREQWEAVVPELRVSLLNAQFDLRHRDFSVLIVVAGDDREGVNEVLHRLHEWLDARYVGTEVFFEPGPEGAVHPMFWRYWRELPADGSIGLFVGAWPLAAVARLLDGDGDHVAFQWRLGRMERFERMLAEDGTLLLKFWIERDRHKRKKRKSKALSGGEWDRLEPGKDLDRAVDELLEVTDTSLAPWHRIQGEDGHTRDVFVARTIADAITWRLEAEPSAERHEQRAPRVTPPDFLGNLDLSSRLERDEYKRRKARLQKRLGKLSIQARNQAVPSVLVFEGFDAAGKGGCIRRVTQAMEPRDYRVVPISAPSPEEASRHYMWRFWERLPRDGRMVIFDRSWYGRVLVERVEGFATEAEWSRAFAEINDFESQLQEHGVVLLKVFLSIDKETQMERFRARLQTPYKKYKITEDDFRNRQKWPEYSLAINDMLARTSPERAPWHLVPANDKRFARVRVLERVCDALSARLR